MHRFPSALLASLTMFLAVARAQPPLSSEKELVAICPGKRESSFADRSKAREALLRDRGGNVAAEAAVARGLKWLADNQQDDGRWRLDDPSFRDKGAANDTAATAFGLLPFLAAGKTHKAAKENAHNIVVEKGLAFLLKKQNKKNGDLGGGMYAHGLAAMALCEAYGLTQDQNLRRPAQMAVNYIVNAQHDGGGWRYTPGQQGDTSVTAWHVQALVTAQHAGLDVPDIALRKAKNFLDGVCSPDEGYGYIAPQATPSMTAAGLLCRQHLEKWGPQHPRLLKGMQIVEREGPNPKNLYYSYYATLAMYHRGGEAWTKWNEKMRDALIERQEKEPQIVHMGSWYAKSDLHGQSGGQLMQTSLALLTLEIYYRYRPLFWGEEKK